MTSLTELDNRKIAILGLGQEGISTAKYLHKHGYKYSILDANSQLVVDDSITAGVEELVLGDSYLDKLQDYDVVFRSPGVRVTLPEIQAVKKAGKIVTSQTKLFFDLCPAQIIGVTGTKGKGTTSSLVYEILRSAGKKAILGGNIGAPVLDFLDETTSDMWVVLELSSFQLIDLERSPKVAIVLGITVDHLDYHGTEGAYWAAKSSLVRYQKETDFAILNHDSSPSLSMGHKTKAKQIYFSRKVKVSPGVFVLQGEIFTEFQAKLSSFMPVSEVPLVGPHNLENVTGAVAAAKVLGIDDEVIRNTVKTFKGLPHRLELVGEVDGVRFYDDSASTNPETAIAAIRSFTKPEVFILGGSSKNADFSKLGQEICLNPNIVGVILIGQEKDRIHQAIKSGGTFSGFILTESRDLKEAVTRAAKLTPEGGVVVLSPACASFDMFKNYHDRGQKFQEEVKLLHET